MAGYIPISPDRPEHRAVFNRDFFQRKFHSFIRAACDIKSSTTVLELVLAGGETLDISHFVEFDDSYVLAAVFLDTRSCGTVYHAYVRYETIYRVNVVEAALAERPVGFKPGA